MTQVFYASTLFGAMSLAAAVDSGAFGPRAGRRLLLVSNNAAVPEVATPLERTPGFAVLRARFDEVVSWNELIAPLHPSAWKARVIEVPLLERLIRAKLGLGEVEELVLESIAVPPARTVAGLIRDCPITVYADGLMSYGPTRDPLPAEISRRISRLLHLDLLPGLAPLLLSEYGVAASTIDDEAFLAVVGQVAASAPDMLAGQAMILGQYLSALEILTPQEEAALHESMLKALADLGFGSVVFKPHPAAGRRHARLLRAAAEPLGVKLSVVDETVPAEVCFAALRPELVVGCFSTGLVTARHFYGLPAAAFGTELVLERLTPYENSNRIPATVVDALLCDGRPPVEEAVRAVGYCMQPESLPELRPAAEAFIGAYGTSRYFKRQRLSSLELLPGSEQPSTLSRIRRRLTRALS